MIRAGAYIMAALIVLAGVILGSAWIAVGNEPASVWLLNRSARLVPGELILEGLSGNLISGMSATTVRYRGPDMEITGSMVNVHVQWADLIDGRLTILRLRADALRAVSADAGEPGGELEIPALPLPVRLRHMAIDQLVFERGEVRESIQNLAVQAALTGHDLNLTELQMTVRGIDVSFGAQVQLIAPFPVGGRLAWRLVDAELSGAGDFAGDLNRLRVTHEVRFPDVVKIAGELTDLLRDPAADLTVDWQTFAWPLPNDERLTSRGGQLTLAGTARAFRAGLQADLEVTGYPRMTVRLTGHGNPGFLDVDGWAGLGDRGTLVGNGRIELETPSVRLQLVGTGLDMTLLHEELAGRIDFTAAIDARAANDFSVDVKSLNGMVLGRAVIANGQITQRVDALEVSALQVHVGLNHLEIDGTLRPRLAGRFVLEAPELERLWPELAGRVAGSGSVTGSLAEPVMQANLDGFDLTYRDQGVARLSLAGEVDVNGRIDWAFGAIGLRLGDRDLGDLQGAVSGSLTGHDLSLDLSGGPVSAAVRSTGGWDGSTLNHLLTRVVVASPTTGTWWLQEAVEVDADRDHLKISPHCWNQPPAVLCLEETEWAGGMFSTAGELQQFPLSVFDPWLGAGIQLHGQAEANFALRGGPGDLGGHLRWRQENTRLVYEEQPGTAPMETRLTEAELEIVFTAQQARLQGRVRGDYGVELDMTGTIADPLTGNGALDARLRARVPDLAASAPLINRFVSVRNLKGAVAANWTVTGTLQAPEILGEARLTDGAAFLPPAGIDLEDITLTLAGRPGQPAAITGSARSGTGHMAIDGMLEWSETTAAVAELAVTGQDFELIRFPDQTVAISPEIRARIDEERIALSGSVAVPRAAIKVESLPATAVATSVDVVVHREQVTGRRVRRPGPQIVGELEVTLGDEVRFQGFGIDTRLAGGMRLVRSPGAAAATADGTVRTIDGRFIAYGTELSIERGSLIFSGPIENPSVDARASREIEHDGQVITAGVLLSGPLSNILTRVFSEPTMSDADALSFLVLGRPMIRANEDDADMLSGAALALGLSQALPITRSLESALGLDEVDLDGAGGDDTSVVAGKRLNKDLYVRYAYGLFNRIGTFFVNYRLGGGVSIEAGSGQEQTLDLIYSVDR